MFVLNTAHKEIFEAQIKHVLYNMWLHEFGEITSVSDMASIDNRRSRFGLRGNRYLNAIAQLYGYKSYSSLLSSANPNSTSSMWISNHDIFKPEDDELYSNVYKAIVSRSTCSLVDGSEYVAKSFVRVAKTLKLMNLDNCLNEFPDFDGKYYAKMIDWLTDGGLKSYRKDYVDPVFNEEGYPVNEKTLYFTLMEEGVDGDRNVLVDISPTFSIAEQADMFFKDEFALYCKYLIHVESRYADVNVVDRVSFYSGTIWKC